MATTAVKVVTEFGLLFIFFYVMKGINWGNSE